MRCSVSGCESEHAFDFARFESRRCVRLEHYCAVHARDRFEGIIKDIHIEPFVGTGASYSLSGAVNVDLEAAIFYCASLDYPGYIYMREINGKRWFCTVVSRDAYHSVLAAIGLCTAPRPFLHSAWDATIKGLGAAVKDVVVDKANDGGRWFDGKVRIIKGDQLMSVDVRAGDAYALAVTTGAPIFAVERVLGGA